VFSGGWAGPDDDLILADTGNALIRYKIKEFLAAERGALNGYPIPIELSLSLEIPGEEIYPSLLRQLPGQDGFMMENGEGVIVLFSDNMERVEGVYSLLAQENSKGQSLGSIVQFVPSAKKPKVIVAFCDIKMSAAGNWLSGFVEIDLERPSRFEILGEPMPISDDSRSFYYLGNPYIASTPDSTELVLMASAPRIVHFAQGAQGDRTWSGYGSMRRLGLPPKTGPKDVKSLYLAVANSSIPTSLFTWDSAVYVLDRRSEEGVPGSEWYVSALGSAPGVEIQLPEAGAQHLTLIAGSRFWALLHKGPVLGPSQQDIFAVTLIPASAVRGALGTAEEQAGYNVKVCSRVVDYDP
jgi:hypothetical protein